jgi:dTDP-4-dehydrorhamnose reductase
MIAKLRQREKIALPDTVVQSPVLADHLAEVSLKLLKQGKTGIYHVAGREGVSRFEFLRKATEVLGLDPNSVLKGTLQDLEKSWGIPEELSGIVPLNAALNVEKVEQTLGIPMLTLSEGISKIKDILLK